MSLLSTSHTPGESMKTKCDLYSRKYGTFRRLTFLQPLTEHF